MPPDGQREKGEELWRKKIWMTRQEVGARTEELHVELCSLQSSKLPKLYKLPGKERCAVHKIQQYGRRHKTQKSGSNVPNATDRPMETKSTNECNAPMQKTNDLKSNDPTNGLKVNFIGIELNVEGLTKPKGDCKMTRMCNAQNLHHQEVRSTKRQLLNHTACEGNTPKSRV